MLALFVVYRGKITTKICIMQIFTGEMVGGMGGLGVMGIMGGLGILGILGGLGMLGGLGIIGILGMVGGMGILGGMGIIGEKWSPYSTNDERLKTFS
jgi:hypothetical protein